MQPIDEGIPCGNCHKSFLDFTDISYLENCNHMICKECLTDSINLHYPESFCPIHDCEIKLFEAEIRQVLGEKTYDDLQTKMTSKALEGQLNLVKCPCGNMIEVLQGEVSAFKDDNGKNISKTAQKHMSMYRVRCPECQKNFCSGCQEQPYHIGKTCA